MAVKPIPEGHQSVSPYVVVEGAAKLIDFVKDTFGAEEAYRMPMPGGKIGHAEVRIGDSIVMLADATDEFKPTTATIHVYVENVDDVYQRALKAGGTSEREPADQFYGDRYGSVKDAFGNRWWISTHIEDVPPAEMQKRMEDWMKQQGQG